MVLRADRNLSVDSDIVSNLVLLFVARTHVLTIAFVHGSKYYFHLSISVSFYWYEYQIIATIPTILSVYFPFLFFPLSFNHLNSNYLSILNPKLIYILILIFSLILVFILPSIGCRGTVAVTSHATQTVYVRWQYVRSIGVWSIQINSTKTREEMKRDKKIMEDRKERSSRKERTFLGLLASFWF